MDRKRLSILLTAAILILAIFLGMEIAAARQEAQSAPEPSASTTAATTVPAESTEAETVPGVTLPPNMLPIG